MVWCFLLGINSEWCLQPWLSWFNPSHSYYHQWLKQSCLLLAMILTTQFWSHCQLWLSEISLFRCTNQAKLWCNQQSLNQTSQYKQLVATTNWGYNQRKIFCGNFVNLLRPSIGWISAIAINSWVLGCAANSRYQTVRVMDYVNTFDRCLVTTES